MQTCTQGQNNNSMFHLLYLERSYTILVKMLFIYIKCSCLGKLYPRPSSVGALATHLEKCKFRTHTQKKNKGPKALRACKKYAEVL